MVIRDKTVVATISLAKANLKVETNSVRRADSARKILESACGSLVQFRIRDLVDPISAAAREAAAGAGAMLQPPTEEMLAMARQQKEQHYSTWPDEPLPILRGRTPRQAARTKEGREQVDALLRDFEHFEEHEPAAARFDVASLRRELGLK